MASPVAQAPAQGGGEKIQIAFQGNGASNAASWSAIDGGYFQQYGIDPDPVNLSASPQGVATILSGQIPFNCAMNGGPFAAAQLQGADTVMLAAAVNTLPTSLFVQEGIASPEDLRGKTIGVNSLGDAANSAARIYLVSQNVDPASVSYIAMGGQPQVLAGLQAKGLDAGVLTPPVTQVAKRAGITELADFGTMGIEYPYNGLGTTRRYLADNRDLMRRVLQAMIAGVHRFKMDQAFGEAVLQKWASVDDQQSRTDVWSAFATRYLTDRPLITDAAERTVLEDLASSTPGAATADPASFHDDSLLTELDQAGFFRDLGIA